jgi:Catalase
MKKAKAPARDRKTSATRRSVRVPSSDAHEMLTTNQGLPISDNQNSLTAVARGPTLLEDFILREKITHFDHERIPERVVHARGTAAHGFFELTASLSDYTTAKVLTDVGERTPVFVASRPSRTARVRSTRRATCAASRSSCTRKRATTVVESCSPEPVTPKTTTRRLRQRT